MKKIFILTLMEWLNNIHKKLSINSDNKIFTQSIKFRLNNSE